jgi:putative addiction module component (TIGR02574 family)
MDPKTIEKDALDLPADERAKLAQKLILSLEDLAEPELEQVWLQEAHRRARQLDAGDVTAIPAEEVRQRARALLR